jgi:uncharacterized protein
MIIYQEAFGTFAKQCRQHVIADIIKTSLAKNGVGGGGTSEYNSWSISLPIMAEALVADHMDENIDVAVEYKLTSSKSRVDFLVYGDNENNIGNLVVVELKQWSSVKESNMPNYVMACVAAGDTTDHWHPSCQAFNYANLLREFNEYVYKNNVPLESCSFCHNMTQAYSFLMKNEHLFPLIKSSPAFLKGDEKALADFIQRNVKKPHKDLLYLIDNSRIRPSEEFASLFVNAMKGKEFETYDDGQAYSVARVISEVKTAIAYQSRKTIIIRGGPGTGKSVVAMNILGGLLHPLDGSKPKNVCYCTPNYTPRTVFSEILIDNDYKKAAIAELFKTISSFTRCSVCDYDCVVVDEAHRAFNWKFGYGVKKGIDMIDKLFYASRVNVFFIDEDQRVSKDDRLTVDLIKAYAKKYGSEVIEGEDLKLTSQFRCLGGEDYVAFISTFLGFDNERPLYRPGKYDFQIFDSPSAMRDAIYAKNVEFGKSRIVAGDTYAWISESDPEGNDPNDWDIVLEDGKFKMRWNKKQSKSYLNDKTQYDRVGCVHTVQGIDLNYCGVILGTDILYRDGKVIYDSTPNTAKDRIGTDPELAKELIRNGYKVLLTRGIRGTYVYCQDKALQEHLKSSIIKE